MALGTQQATAYERHCSKCISLFGKEGIFTKNAKVSPWTGKPCVRVC